MTRAGLLGTLTVGCGVESTVVSQEGPFTGLVQGIQREDGSGRCFNVSMTIRGQAVVVFVKTVD